MNDDELLAHLVALKQAVEPERVTIRRVIVGPDGKPTGEVIPPFPLPPPLVTGRMPPPSKPSEDDEDQRS